MVDIPDIHTDAMKAEAEALAKNPIAEGVMGMVGNVAHEKVAEMHQMADAKGLGGIMDTVVNMAEAKTGMDIDGDGDVAK
jgi:D-alanyl-D-alanine dipeptidase